MTISANGKRVYFSGMLWSEYKGDVWYSLGQGPLRRITLETTYPGHTLGRINGIELSGDGRRLFATSAHNKIISGSQKPQSAQVYALDLDAAGRPEKGAKWRMMIDLYRVVGKKEALKSGLDPDGMRLDSKGIMYSTLYDHAMVLAWDTNGRRGKKVELIKLPTIQSPTNLEMGGKDGRTLVIVGICKKKNAKEEDKACVDMIRVPNPGRAITDLRKRTNHY
jgi:sugar lactone lactonase YvrE